MPLLIIITPHYLIIIDAIIIDIDIDIDIFDITLLMMILIIDY
jgi:hypothetical protein